MAIQLNLFVENVHVQEEYYRLFDEREGDHLHHHRFPPPPPLLRHENY